MRTDMALEMLKAAMASAPNSGSPLLQFLAPIAGSVIGMRAEKLRSDAKASEASSMTEAVLGPQGMSPRARRLLEVLNNENTPDYLRAIAKKQFETAMVPIDSAPTRRSNGGGASSGGGTGSGGAARPARLTYISRDPDGVVRGYNPLTGKREPVPNADSPEGTPASGAGAVRGGGTAADDPLGLRNPTSDNPLELP